MHISPVAINQNNISSVGIKKNSYSVLNNVNGYDSVNFASKKHNKVEKKSGVIHKALVASTGAFVPGLGQALNGQWGKAVLFAVGIPVSFLGTMCYSLPLAFAAVTAAEIGMFVDAYRNA